MEYQKITNLLGKTTHETKVPIFTTKEWIEIFDQSNTVLTKILDLKHLFTEAYIVVTCNITATNSNPSAGVNYSRNLALKNSATFFNCILKINSQLIEDAQDLDVVMPMYNLLYYSKKKTSEKKT